MQYAGLILLLYLLAFAGVNPFMPSIVASFFNGDFSRGSLYLGWMVSLNNVTTLLTGPLIGVVSDRYGRKPVLLFSAIGLVVSILGLWLGLLFGSVWPAFVLHVAAGGFGGFFPFVYAYITDFSTDREKTRNYSFVGATFGVAFIAGPLTYGAIITAYGYQTFLFVILIIVCLCIGCIPFIPESHKKRGNVSLKYNPLSGLSKVWHTSVSWRACLAFFILYFAEQGLFDIWVMYFKYRYEWDDQHVGIALGCAGLGMVIGQAVVLPALNVTLNDKYSALVGISICILTITQFIYVRTQWLVYALAFLQATGLMIQPVLCSIFNKEFPPHIQGVSGIIGPPAASGLFHIFTSNSRDFPGEWWSERGLKGVAEVVFIWAIGCFLLSAALAWILKFGISFSCTQSLSSANIHIMSIVYARVTPVMSVVVLLQMMLPLTIIKRCSLRARTGFSLRNDYQSLMLFMLFRSVALKEYRIRAEECSETAPNRSAKAVWVDR
ncbi:hypothetical protein PROFUN_12620 [Planoprotostelium fungivorum]|uniref:Major facilitator superfamily (MFS) profile domain-containing protein n=1 Tax=Planoprotostelium fungivorum TaxID=1890364 RepID=A0A2P6N738_9EUKA|nr:hypothetical protein PROFUN_12620 [Planoprotostelium fungivorum]